MISQLKLIYFLAIFLISITYAQNTKIELSNTIKKDIEQLKLHDELYMKIKGLNFFKQLSKGQHPLFTVVTCSDSRIQANVFDEHPEGNDFTIRNIGNQLQTAMGSVEYGVLHLNSQILLIIGHSECGAIDAVLHDYSHLEPAIIKELDTLKISNKTSNMGAVRENVNNQVALALKRFAKKIEQKELVVVGAIYDFSNELHQGAGEFLIININGETDPVQLKKIIS